MTEYEHMELDFSQLLVPDIKFAVRCETEEEARQFVVTVIEQFPDKDSYFHSNDVRWDEDNYGLNGGRAYFPDLNNVENEPFMHGDVRYAEAYGYTIVYFKDLIVKTQLEESDMPLDMLFGASKV